MSSLVIGVVLDSGGEEGIDECSLAQARFASNLDKVSRDTKDSDSSGHTIIVNAAPLFATILCRWLGRLAMPMGEADSTLEGAMLVGCGEERVTL